MPQLDYEILKVLQDGSALWMGRYKGFADRQNEDN